MDLRFKPLNSKIVEEQRPELNIKTEKSKMNEHKYKSLFAC